MDTVELEEFIRKNLKIEIVFKSAGWDYYESAKNYKILEIRLLLNDEVISKSDVDIIQ